MRYTQPQFGPAQIDWANSITQGLVEAHVNGIECVTNKPNGAILRRASPAGIGESTTGVYSAALDTATITVIGHVLLDSDNGDYNGLLYGYYTSGSDTSQLGASLQGNTVYWINRANGSAAAVSGSYTLGVGAVYAISAVLGSGGNARCYINGKFQTLIAQSGTRTFAPDTRKVLSVASSPVGKSSAWAFRFNRILSDVEIASLSANPWQVYKSTRRILNSSAIVGNSGTLVSTQSPNTLSSSGTISVSGTLTSTQVANSSAISGASSIAGNLGSTQFANTSAVSGTTLASGALNSTQQLNTSNIAGVVVMGIGGTLASTQQPNTSTASGTVTVSGTLTSTQIANTSTMSGIVVVTGTLVSTQQANTSNIAGTVSTSNVIGILASTQATNTSVASGVVVVSGTLGSVQVVNASAISGQVQVSGALASTQAQNTSSIAGNSQVTGTLNGAQSPNISTISGTVTVAMPGTLASAQAPNSMVSTGSVSVSGTLASTQNPNLSNITNIISLLFGAQNQLRVNILAGPAASATFASPVLIDLGGGFGVTSSGSLVLII